ncbi:MAG: NfeD family protein [Hominilimicola sp.]
MEPNVIIWLIGIIVFIILEAATYQIVSIWFALGAVGGLVASLAGANFTVQMIIFIALSVIFLICLRPVSRRLLKFKHEKTNVDSILGKEVLITKEVDNLRGGGQGKVNGVVWTVKSADNVPIPENDIAVVEKVEGVKLIVKRKGE